MAFNFIKGEIEKYFVDNWSTKTPIEFANSETQKSFDVNWVRLNVLMNESFQNGFAGGGVNEYRTTGIILVNIFVKEGEGIAAGDSLADSINKFFRGAEFSGVVCSVPSLTDIGKSGGWYQLNVSTPFIYDEIN